MFSNRIRWSLEPNELSRAIERRRLEGAALLDLTLSNPTRAGLEYPAGMAGCLAVEGAMVYEPEPRGIGAAREAVAGYYRSKGVAVDPGRIHLTASTSEGYSYLFKLLANGGEKVLSPRPSYPLLDFLSSLEGVRLGHYSLDYSHSSGWRIDFDSLERAIDHSTRAIILVNPNNPTGSFVRGEELERLNRICRERSIALIVDEVFADYVLAGGEGLTLAGNDGALTFVLSGLSKVLALPQMKLGWIVTSGPGQLPDRAIERLDLIADTFLSVGAPVQHAAPRWLELRETIQGRISARVEENLRTLGNLVEGSPCRLLKAEGGWYGVLEIPRIHGEEEWVLKLLDEDGVLVHPGYFFDFEREAFLVVSLLPETGTFAEAARRIFGRNW